jgi:aminopeptidase I
VGWELEMFDSQSAQLGGLDGEFIFAGRLDDKLCSWAAIESLLASSTNDSSVIKMVGLFDDEEIGSLQRQGARGNMLPSTIERICEAFAEEKSCTGTLYQTYANSFLVSADVCHAYNPNYGEVYLRDHSARMNVGVAVAFDSNAHMTTDGPSYALLSRVAERSDSVLQITQIRNDGRGGGTVGPMLASATGMRAIDAGIPQLSMHSIRATTGDLDPGLGVQLFKGFFDHYEEVDKEFQ